MQTALADFIRDTHEGREADSILRACVHCGFCTATCPTYQLLGDELDGPRGRIYLIKQVLEGVAPTQRTQLHLDRCLTCRACETTCPSGVQYGRLVDIGRELVEKAIGRPWLEKIQRRLLAAVLSRRVIDAWWPAVERGEVEATVMTASGCGVTVKEYGHLLAGDPAYRDKAVRISAMTRDIAEVLAGEAPALAKQLEKNRAREAAPR